MKVKLVYKGGPGSGFTSEAGHKGIPGHQGGSQSGGRGVIGKGSGWIESLGTHKKEIGNKRSTIREPSEYQHRDKYEVRVWMNGIQYVRKTNYGDSVDSFEEAKSIADNFFKDDSGWITYQEALNKIREGDVK